MAAALHVCVILVVAFECVRAGVISGKELFCRDPDTGKLHAVNTTWTSTKFCGNYTCKLRQRINRTEMEYAPSRIINVEVMPPKLNETAQDTAKSFQSNSPIEITKKTIPDLQSVLHKGNKNDKQAVDDRYLTESEIKTISELLHTVKKSDLEAIVEIYNVAQEIYKEMDKVTTENILEETISSIQKGKANEPKEDITPVENNHVSYWYEPLSYINQKQKESKDLNVSPSIPLPSTPDPKLVTSSSFYPGSFSSTFAKLPYYYPMSDFQRAASYVHNPTPAAKPETKPCQSATNAAVNLNPFLSKFKSTETKPLSSVLLTFPFSYVHHYNMTHPNQYYFGANPWVNYERNFQTNQPAYIAAYAASPSNAILVNPELRVPDVELTPAREENIINTVVGVTQDNRPAWQTKPLPESVLDEVRAHIAEKTSLLKAMPFKKKVKLERVGKVIKLDEISRSKRELDNETLNNDDDGKEFEVYIEKTTCQSDTEPGFFRVGNLSQPFPSCCPQRIKKL